MVVVQRTSTHLMIDPEVVGLTPAIAGLCYVNNIIERYRYSFSFLLSYYYSMGYSSVFIKKNPNRG